MYMTNKVESNLNSIINNLGQVSDIYFEYDAAKRKAVNDLRDQALTDAVKAAETKARNAVAFNVKQMTNSVDIIITETDYNNQFDPEASDALANAAKLIAIPGLSISTAESLVRPFIGSQTALQILSAAASKDVKGVVDAWLFDSIGCLNGIKSAINMLLYESLSNYPSIVSSIRESVWGYASHQGIDLGGMGEKLEEMKQRNICALMGIDYNKTFGVE